MLEAEGLIAPRLGRYGGWQVQRPAQETVSRSIDVFIRGRQIRFGSLLEAREAIEPACARLAAVHRSDEDLAVLDACEQRLASCWRDVDTYLRENVVWHLAVVAASGNELLIAVMSALGDAVHAATDIAEFNSEDVRRAALAAHRGVVEAIRVQDPDAAFRRMYRHLHAFRVAATAEPSVREAPVQRAVAARRAASANRAATPRRATPRPSGADRAATARRGDRDRT